MGYKSIYYEQEPGNCLRQLHPFLSPIRETDGMLCYHYFKGFPFYGPGVSLSLDTAAEFDVYDYGNSLLPEDMHFDIILLICSNGIWHWHDTFQKGEYLKKQSSHLIIICNMGQKNTMRCFSKQFLQEVYQFPYESSPFGVSSSKVSFFSTLLRIKKRRKFLFFHLRNKFIQKK